MRKVSEHFFMEVMLSKLHATVDKYATLDVEGVTILYTTREQPVNIQRVTLADALRIFEDLYGEAYQRWDTTQDFECLQLVKRTARKRKLTKRSRTRAAR